MMTDQVSTEIMLPLSNWYFFESALSWIVSVVTLRWGNCWDLYWLCENWLVSGSMNLLVCLVYSELMR
jgi:hypothetical protein